MLELILGLANTGKTTHILGQIARSGGIRPQLLIVPEQHSHNMERQLCATAGNSVSLYAEVLSFTRLAGRVFSVGGGVAMQSMDAGGRLLLMDVALHQVAERLKIYARPSRRPEFLAQLSATIDECKSSAILPEQLYEVAQQAEGEMADKFYDLSLIYGAYDALTQQRKADPRDKLTRLAESLEKTRWAEGQDIYIDGFTDFTRQERQVLAQLFRQASHVTVALTCDGLEGESDSVFAPARKTARQLLRLAKEVGIAVKVTTFTETAPQLPKGLLALEEHLFDPVLRPSQEGSEGVELYRAESVRTEVERTAAEVLRLVREEGYRWRDVTVSTRSMDKYGPLIDLTFRRYGIPIFLSRMDDVLQKPILTLVTAALDSISNGYRYEDVFRYLKTGLAGLSRDETDQLENYVLRWNLRGSAWTQKKPWSMHPEGYGRPWSDRDREQVERLDQLRRRVSEPLEHLRQSEEQTGAGLALSLYRFLEEIQLAQRLEARGEELRGDGNATLAAEYEQLWAILCTAMEQCAELLGETGMGWEEFTRLFKLVLSQYEVGTIPVSLDRVTVGEMPRLAHKHCKVLFLLGMDDGMLPAVVPSPGLMNDEDRSLLAQLGLESGPQLSDKLWREMTIAYESCTLPTERLLVSYPQMGDGGEERRPSFLVKKLRQLFPELPVSTELAAGASFRWAAPLPALEVAGESPQLRRALKAIPELQPLVERMERAAGLERGHLSRPAVELLYGKRIPMSASRMDKYKSCHFSYFMQYGLQAKPRKPAGFAAPEYGTFVHYVLEHVLRERKGKEIPDRETVAGVIQRYVQEELGGLAGETPRFRYLFRRLEKSVYAVVENVCQELAQSDFVPIAFELGFGRHQQLPPVEISVDGVTVSISGLVDRVDGWEKDGRLYLRVVDYKTGRKSFDLTDVWNGLGLQMLLYLFTLEEKGEKVFGMPIEPAGVLYLPAQDVLVSGERAISEEARQKAVDSQLRRKGLVLNDPAVMEAMEHMEGSARFLPVRVSKTSGEITGDALVTAEQLGKLQKHIEGVLSDIAGELAAGNIAADPFWRGPQQNACQWCEYADACQFREGTGGDRKRWLATVGAKEFWERLGAPMPEKKKTARSKPAEETEG